MVVVIVAYASLHSLLQVLDNPACRRLSPNTTWIPTLLEKISFLIEFLENHSGSKDEEEDIEDLARQIDELANEAENIIEFHVVDLLCDEHIPRIFREYIYIKPSSFCQDMDKVIEKIDHVKEKLLTMVQEYHKEAVKEKLPRISLPSTAGSISVPVPLPSGAKNTAVGLDYHVVQIMEKLIGNRSNLQIIPIVGMGGIGKTTLARNVYDNKYVIEHFDIRIWFTISQEYSVHETLLQVLRDVGVSTGDLKSETLAELGQRLHKTLFGKRYLIVMDDLWCTTAWDEFKFFFNDNCSESRIMVTTRMLNVAVYVGSCDPYEMNLLDDDQSWDLLCKFIVGQESCSTNLGGIGKRIAQGCRGLPLALVAIGGLLAKSDMTQEYWEFVARDVNSFFNLENDDHCLKVLDLSYNHLPIHLKPCFLYMSIFPEDCDVRVSDLIKLWVAEGFLKPIKGREWEEVAKEYLKDLIDRNLIFIRKRGKTGEVKTCGIHDLLRDLSVRKSYNKLLFGIPKVQRVKFEMLIGDEKKCVLCNKGVQQKEMKHILKLHRNSRLTSSVSVLACEGCSTIMNSDLSSRLRVVRAVKVKHFLGYVEFLQPTKLRYFSLNCDICRYATICPSLHLLWNLQTLTIDMIFFNEKVPLPSEIWVMTQLRHISIRKNVFILPDPVVVGRFMRRRDVTILENLKTLSTIYNFRCTEALLERIPNLTKLGIVFDVPDEDEDAYWSTYTLSNKLVNLHKLESLSLRCSRRSYIGEIAFPYLLKKLKLTRCEIPWEKMSMIGFLPNLEVLQLFENAFIGIEWNPVEGEFCRLKYLSIVHHYDWERWGAENIHFPVLQSLQFGWLRDLEGIPSGIGDIPTLRSIVILDCNESINESAKKIVEEQQGLENEDLHVYIDGQRYQIDDAS